jgi:hypothetical protein
MGYSTVLTLIALGVESYVTICHHSLKNASVTRAIVILLFIWIIAVISALPTIANTKTRLLYFSAKTNKFIFLDYHQSRALFDSSNHPTECLVQDSEICGYYYNEEGVDKETSNYISISTLIFFILPMILLGVLYICIRIRLQRTPADRQNQELMRKKTIGMLGLLLLIFKFYRIVVICYMFFNSGNFGCILHLLGSILFLPLHGER